MFDLNFKNLIKTGQNSYSIDIKLHKQVIELLLKLKMLEYIKPDKIILELKPNETMIEFFAGASSDTIQNFIEFRPNAIINERIFLCKIRAFPVCAKVLTEDGIQETIWYFDLWLAINHKTKENEILMVNREGEYIASDETEIVKRFCEVVGLEY